MCTKTEILEKLNTLEAAADPGLSFAGIISAVNQLSGSSVSAAMGKGDRRGSAFAGESRYHLRGWQPSFD